MKISGGKENDSFYFFPQRRMAMFASRIVAQNILLPTKRSGLDLFAKTAQIKRMKKRPPQFEGGPADEIFNCCCKKSKELMFSFYMFN